MLKDAFKQTLFVLDQTVTDFKRLKYVCNFGAQVLYITYLIFALTGGIGNTVTNVILLTLCSLYFVFFLAVERINMTKEAKLLRKSVNRVYKILRRSTQAVVIIMSLVALSDATLENDAIDILLCALMIISFMFQLLVDAAAWYAEMRVEQFKAAFIADVKSIRIVNDVIGIVNEVKGIANVDEDGTSLTRANPLLKMAVGAVVKNFSKPTEKEQDSKTKVRFWKNGSRANRKAAPEETKAEQELPQESISK